MKRFVADRFAADAKELSDISNNSGALVQCGTKKVAAYRDNDGKLHVSCGEKKIAVVTMCLFTK